MRRRIVAERVDRLIRLRELRRHLGGLAQLRTAHEQLERECSGGNHDDARQPAPLPQRPRVTYARASVREKLGSGCGKRKRSSRSAATPCASTSSVTTMPWLV